MTRRQVQLTYKMDEFREGELHASRVFRVRLEMNQNSIQDLGINAEHCWTLMTIAEQMRNEGYGTTGLEDELRIFKQNFVWWGGYQTIWQNLHAECMNSLNVF